MRPRSVVASRAGGRRGYARNPGGKGNADPYARFDLLDGSHPWRETAPDGYVDYPARYRPGGRVVYFNFPLAREMGLLPDRHADGLNASLEAKILETFSLRIINEYDISHPENLKGSSVKPKSYMATRYLQSQHRDKCGRTSGDGRSIWNGCIKAPPSQGKPGLRFDVSSRGTGATILSPGAQEADRPLATGENGFGYASGTADLDEMLGSALMSEIFYREGIPTERCLAVIDYGDGSSIGVRTAPNLVRPAHLFRFLKMGNREELRRGMDYFLERQEENGFWKLPAGGSARYTRALDLIGRSYGRLAAVLEEEYIFNWLAWDGDNVLADGSILDYGSVRQFAAKHDKYRYEDVDRFSTSLREQRRWARMMAQVFAQAADFALTGGKKNFRLFREAACLGEFDRAFREERDRRLLWRIGFPPSRIDRMMDPSAGVTEKIAAFRKALARFEDAKIAKGPEKLSDGITHRPVFLIRNLLRALPRFCAASPEGAEARMDPESFCAVMAASYAGKRDMLMTPSRVRHVREFQDRYRDLIRAAGGREADTLRSVAQRAAVINHEHRLTGNGLVWIIEKILAVKDRLGPGELQGAMEAFIDSQVLIPEKWRPIPAAKLRSRRPEGRLLREIEADLEACKETV